MSLRKGVSGLQSVPTEYYTSDKHLLGLKGPVCLGGLSVPISNEIRKTEANRVETAFMTPMALRMHYVIRGFGGPRKLSARQ